MLAIWIGKLVTWLLRMRGKDATSFPGKIALRISPRLLERFGRQMERVIVVTGTNGKTTTTSLLASMMRRETPVISNHKGANLIQGIATAFLQQTSWSGRCRAKTAVMEVDEATFPSIAASLPITMTVVTNVFRDQLDRYGEIDVTMEKLLAAIRKTETSLVLNGDDPLCRDIGLRLNHKAVYFGMADDTAHADGRRQMRDGQFCLRCGQPLEYEAFWYGQLGLYHCSQCDFGRPHPEFVGRSEGQTMAFSEAGVSDLQLQLPVQGLYNAYNVLAAASGARVAGLSSESIHAGLQQFVAPDGRMQTFHLATPVLLNLIKNPTGCDSVIQAISSDRQEKIVVIGINDLAADGKDVSWLWDADFEMLVEDQSVIRYVSSGMRADDMALRLKYAGVAPSRITTERDMDEAMATAVEMGKANRMPVYVLCTYTLLHPSVHTLTIKAGEDDTTNVAYRTSVS